MLNSTKVAKIILKTAEELATFRADRKVADEVFNAVANRLTYLHARWQDEKEYEDFAEYKDAMQMELAKVNPSCAFKGATKRPFGFKFGTAEGIVRVITVNSKELAMKPVTDISVTYEVHNLIKAGK